MTSGNRRDEPLCRTVAEAKEALGGRVDAFLLHNRPIHQRCDDSVFFVADTGPQPVRRSRGYTPLPVRVPLASPVPVLALGGELKNTFCLLRGREAFLSQHIGDMGSLATQKHFAAALAHMRALFKIDPAVVAHDLHPDYTTSRYAATAGLPLIGVQHHHTLAEIVRTVCTRVREREGLTTVALSGGCWQNRLLLTTTVSRLQEAEFTVYTHRQVPANDGGISLGQAVVAAARLAGSP